MSNFLIEFIAGGLGLLGGSALTLWFHRPRVDPEKKKQVTDTSSPENLKSRIDITAWLELLPCPALFVDHHGLLLHANTEAERIFGEAITSLPRQPTVFSALAAARNSAEAITVDIVLDVPVTRAIKITLRQIPAEMSDTEHPLFLMMLEDRSSDESLKRTRTDFVAYASHELRTPLAALSGFIETLRGPAADDPEASRQFLEIMSGQAQRMQKLIDRLLTLSRVEMLEHRRPQGRIESEDIVGQVEDEISPLLQARGATLEVSVTPLRCPGDPDQIVQVLLNLIENAAKYASTDEHPARIRLTCTGGMNGSKEGILFTVSDDGPGIEAHHLPRLTERFYRVSEGSDGGSGLGLAIVRHIVDRHDGRLMIESTPGQGTTCMIWLPFRPDRRLSRERPSVLLS